MSEEKDCQCMEEGCCCCGFKLKAVAVLLFLGIVFYGLSKSPEKSQEIQICPQDMTKVISERDLLSIEVQELKEENQNLVKKLRNAEAALQMERANKKNPEEASSALPGPQICSLLLGLCVTIVLLL